jgi:hypothetical protein
MSTQPQTRTPAQAAQRAGSGVRRFLFRELSSSPGPASAAPGVRVFRAPGWWKSNVCGAVVAGIAAAGLFAAVGGILLWHGHGPCARMWGAGMLLLATAVPTGLFVGRAALGYPYAAEIEDGRGLRFYAPFTMYYIPLDEVERVGWSWLWGGWLVGLRHRRGVLPGLIIRVAWRRQGRELARAIAEELARRA